MDKGPRYDARPRGWDRTDVLELIRAVALRLGITGVVAVAVAATHQMAFDGSFDAAVATVLLVAAGGLPLLEGASRIHDRHVDVESRTTSGTSSSVAGASTLTPVGILLFVSLPLVVVATFVGA